MVRAAGFGARSGWVRRPPASMQEAANVFGAEISESAWRAICRAFELHGERLTDLEGTRDNRNPNDTLGWLKRKRGAESGIDAALSALGKINRDFLAEAEDLVSLQRSGGLESHGALHRLDKVVDEILFLAWLVREAEPLSKAGSCWRAKFLRLWRVLAQNSPTAGPLPKGSLAMLT